MQHELPELTLDGEELPEEREEVSEGTSESASESESSSESELMSWRAKRRLSSSRVVWLY